ncbi:MAG TPA: exonuclease domain-containing protein [Candidatus Wujingus californicus]|uniref:exonuclease domain-containing protein n=1 Tax=Candidatus Wujingus californicus TaxID=3367618 RepID=UPI004028A429
MNFIALDVETAHGARWSICQIGLVQVNNGKVINQLSKLIKPPENKYSSRNIRIHGISSEITENSPLFPEIWNDIKPLVENQLIVAHNASFDIDCLIQTLKFYKLDIPDFAKVDCTFKRTGAKLSDLCQAMGIDLPDQHDALYDAEACAKIYLKLLNGEAIDYSKVKIHSRPKLHNKLKGNVLKPDLGNADKSSPFYNKKLVFTGVLETISREEAANIVKRMGADINTTVSQKTDFIIVGADPGPSKLKKAEKYNNEGAKIQIIDEPNFNEIIKK